MGVAPGAVLGAKYTVESVLGAGSFGTVYGVTHRTTGRKLALKLAHDWVTNNPVTVARFEREARTIGALDHPNIVEIVDFGYEGELPFIVMERVFGPTLQDFLDARTPPVLTPDEVMDILVPVIAGVAAAHAAGVLHRDIKPANVVLTQRPRQAYEAKVIDFGMAKPEHGSELTAVGSMLGTPAYIAPEVLSGQPATKSSDVWSMGVLLFRCLAGQQPFGGDTRLAVFQNIQGNRREPLVAVAPQTLPPSLVVAVERALAPQVAQRWQDMGQLLDALLGDVGDPGKTSRQHGPASLEDDGTDFDEQVTVRSDAANTAAARPDSADRRPQPPRGDSGSLPELPAHAQPTRVAALPSPRRSSSWWKRLVGLFVRS